MTTPDTPAYNLLMLSGDNSIARGIDSTFSEMLAQFSAYWQRIDILTPTAPDATTQVIHDNVHVHPAPHHRLLQPYFIHQKGTQLLAERPYHLVTSHDYGFFYNGLGAWWLLKNREIPLVSEIHHVEGYPKAVSLRERLWRAAAMRYLPWIEPHVAAFRVVHHSQVPDFLRELSIPDEKILVLHSLYLDFDVFQPLPDVQAHPAYDVLFVGRLTANKGLPILLDAIQQVTTTHPQTTLAIRGAGSLESAIRQRIITEGLQSNVQFLPRVRSSAEMAAVYNRARMLVCASTVEGNPRVTAEAMACGVPVISTPVGIMPELITHGENGFLFQWDADALAGYIRQLLDDDSLRQRIARAGREAVQPFDAASMIQRYAEGYHRLIAQHQ
jgi:glycosyltransferase involved in cell wall biosynthesis